MSIKNKLIELNACNDAIEWVGRKSLTTAWNKCDMGDWMLWLAFKMKDNEGWSNIKEITKAKVECARLVKHLITDQISIDALDVADRWSRNEATDNELESAAYAAYAAANAANAANAAYAAYAASYAAYAAANAAYAASYAANAAANAEILKKCADISRKYLKIGEL